MSEAVMRAHKDHVKAVRDCMIRIQRNLGFSGNKKGRMKRAVNPAFALWIGTPLRTQTTEDGSVEAMPVLGISSEVLDATMPALGATQLNGRFEVLTQIGALTDNESSSFWKFSAGEDPTALSLELQEVIEQRALPRLLRYCSLDGMREMLDSRVGYLTYLQDETHAALCVLSDRRQEGFGRVTAILERTRSGHPAVKAAAEQFAANFRRWTSDVQ